MTVQQPLGLLRAVWPVYALVAVGALCACLYGLVAAPFSPRLVAQADGDTLLLPERGTDLRVYGAAPDPERVDCSVDPEGGTFVGGIVLGTRVVDGQELAGLAKVSDGWADGAVVTCPTATRLAAVEGSTARRWGFVLLTGFLALGASAFALVGALSARRARTPAR